MTSRRGLARIADRRAGLSRAWRRSSLSVSRCRDQDGRGCDAVDRLRETPPRLRPVCRSPGSFPADSLLPRQALDLGEKTATTTRQSERLPRRREPHYTILEGIFVVLAIEVSLLELIVHVVPVRLLRDLPHPEP